MRIKATLPNNSFKPKLRGSAWFRRQDSVIIRNAKPDDAASLAGLAHTLGQAVEAAGFSQDIAAYTEGFYVAEMNGAISGYLVMRIEHCPGCVQGRSPIQLWRLFVAPEHQGTGVAAGLVSQAFARARGES